MLHRAFVGLLVCLASCDKGSAAPSTEPPTAAAVDPAPAAPPMTNTGVLSEDEFKKLHEHTGESAPAPKGEMIDLGGTKAYLSLPVDAAAPVPAIVVIHEWWGLNDNIKHWSDRLAADGYAALAVDLYGGQFAKEPDKALELMKAVDETAAAKVLADAHAFLASDPRVGAKKRGVIGWCFGGGWSLQHAMSTPDLDAAVIYYGRLVDNPDELSKIGAQVMGVFGNKDKGIPPASVDRFEAAMKTAGKSLEVHRYEADHAFANPSSARYEQDSAADAWAHSQAFFAKHLKGE